jgi:lipoprotein-anchoring transpeptidase ErfK/SrfK
MINLTDAVSRTALAVAAAGTLWSSAAFADPLALFDTLFRPNTAYDEALRDRSPGAAADAVSLHNRAPIIDEGVADTADVPANLRRQVVAYPTTEPAGTIVIDTPHTYLYLVLGSGKAMRYGIGVGREGFTWSGTQTITRKQEWPDWIPPAEMLQRQPYLPRFMAGGPGNPLGARAMYLGNTVYRIHGTNAPSTIGHQVSSGCIRMINEDVTDLYGRVNVGSKVVVLPMGSRQQPNVARTRSAPAHSSVVPASEPAAPATRTFVTSNSARAFGLY